jgi:hypothetical protein
MTIREFVESYCTDRLMPESEAAKVAELVRAYPSVAAVRFSDPTGAYPKALLGVIQAITKKLALEYIDRNRPEAFYRPAFVEGGS